MSSTSRSSLASGRRSSPGAGPKPLSRRPCSLPKTNVDREICPLDDPPTDAATAAASGCDDVLVLTIRFARGDDLLTLPDIERRAGEAFRALDMDAVADDDPLSVRRLADYQQAGRAWVAEDAGQVVGYLLLDVVAGAAHIEQVSVDPAHARRRIGSQLIEAAAAWACHHGLRAMTLTSFALVPWNAPYYTRLGFVVLPNADSPRSCVRSGAPKPSAGSTRGHA